MISGSTGAVTSPRREAPPRRLPSSLRGRGIAERIASALSHSVVRSECLLFVALIGCGTKRDPESVVLPSRPAAPDSGIDWKEELDWARAHFPSIASLRTELDLGPLLAWLPGEGAATLFLTMEDEQGRPDAHAFRCAAVEARRADRGRAIALSIPVAEGEPRSSPTRRFIGATVRSDGVSVGDTGWVERMAANGQWERADEYATAGRSFGLSIGPVERDAAWFRYASVAVGVSCGPTEPIACASGGGRPCNVCREVTIELTPSGPGRLPPTHRIAPPPAPATCTEPCPRALNPDLVRARRLFEHWKTAFVLSSQPSSRKVALFRTEARCLEAQRAEEAR